jgi:hypothetical protein
MRGVWSTPDCQGFRRAIQGERILAFCSETDPSLPSLRAQLSSFPSRDALRARGVDCQGHHFLEHYPSSKRHGFEYP